METDFKALNQVIEIYHKHIESMDIFLDMYQKLAEGEEFSQRFADVPEKIPLEPENRTRDDIDYFFDKVVVSLIKKRLGDKEANIVRFFYYRGVKDADAAFNLIRQFVDYVVATAGTLSEIVYSMKGKGFEKFFKVHEFTFELISKLVALAKSHHEFVKHGKKVYEQFPPDILPEDRVQSHLSKIEQLD